MATRVQVETGQRWRYKPNRGSGTFDVVRVRGDRVTLRDLYGVRRDKSVSLKTLRDDYELAH